MPSNYKRAVISAGTITNALTIDVEGFVESSLQSFRVPKRYLDDQAERYEIEHNMDVVLKVLSESGVRATFFFVGTVTRRLPALVGTVAALGHEVGSHSYVHRRVFDLPRDEFAAGLAASKAELEELAGGRVYGFRAPEFSITRTSTWALDCIRDLGFEYDSSIYPTRLHDVYGIGGAPPVIHTLPNGLVEYPLSTTDILGRRIPFGGGGYFRLYPLRITERLIRRQNRMGEPSMFFIHPYEVGPVLPRIDGMSAYRRFRHYYHCSAGERRLRRLLEIVRFAPAIDVLRAKGVVQ